MLGEAAAAGRKIDAAISIPRAAATAITGARKRRRHRLCVVARRQRHRRSHA